MTEKTSVRERLEGGWMLESYTETNVDTGEVREPLGTSATGFILYTSDGFISAHMNAVNRAPFSAGDMFQGTPDEYQSAGQTSLAYSGRYEVDEDRGRVRHMIGVSAFPNWAGREQVRLAELDHDTLTLPLRDAPAVQWRDENSDLGLAARYRESALGGARLALPAVQRCGVSFPPIAAIRPFGFETRPGESPVSLNRPVQAAPHPIVSPFFTSAPTGAAGGHRVRP